jgi:hypothetical protein
VDRVDASDEAQQRLDWVLASLAGDCSVAEACEALGISESRFHQIRERALAGAAAALERGRAGRPRREVPVDAGEVEHLKAKVAALEEEVVIERTRAALARDLPHLLDGVSSGRRGEKTERPPGSVAGRGRKSGGRRRVVRPPDSRADESDS